MAEWDEDDWKQDCMRWHGRELTGEQGHWCPDWDFLPIDKTCKEFESCMCGVRDTSDDEPLDEVVADEAVRQVLATSDEDVRSGNWPPLVKSVLGRTSDKS